MRLADDFARRDVRRREQGRRAMPQVVVVRRAGMPGASGSIGWVRSRAWIWLFSSTHKTMTISGGVSNRPTMSRTFSTNIGSVEGLKVSRRRGCSPKACQMRRIAFWLMPISPAISLVLQRVPPLGTDSRPGLSGILCAKRLAGCRRPRRGRPVRAAHRDAGTNWPTTGSVAIHRLGDGDFHHLTHDATGPPPDAEKTAHAHSANPCR